eukprot:6206771-Pleurochrysis_carterae.AAC.1
MFDGAYTLVLNTRIPERPSLIVEGAYTLHLFSFQLTSSDHTGYMKLGHGLRQVGSSRQCLNLSALLHVRTAIMVKAYVSVFSQSSVYCTGIRMNNTIDNMTTSINSKLGQPAHFDETCDFVFELTVHGLDVYDLAIKHDS